MIGQRRLGNENTVAAFLAGHHPSANALMSVGCVLIVASSLMWRCTAQHGDTQHFEEGTDVERHIEAPAQHCDHSQPPALNLSECACISAEPDWYKQGLDTARNLLEQAVITPEEHRAEVAILEAELERQRAAKGQPGTTNICGIGKVRRVREKFY